MDKTPADKKRLPAPRPEARGTTDFPELPTGEGASLKNLGLGQDFEAASKFGDGLLESLFPFSPMPGIPGGLGPVQAREKQDRAEEESEKARLEQEREHRQTMERGKEGFQSKCTELEGMESRLVAPANFSLPSFLAEKARLEQQRDRIERKFGEIERAIHGVEESFRQKTSKPGGEEGS